MRKILPGNAEMEKIVRLIFDLLVAIVPNSLNPSNPKPQKKEIEKKSQQNK